MPDAPHRPSSPGDLVFLDPESGLEIRALSPSERPLAEGVLREACSEPQADIMLAALAGIPDGQAFGAFRHGALIATYALRRDGMANDLAVLAVRPDARRKGIGRALLQDALRRSGRRPLAAEIPEAVLPFFKACGFKLVGRRPQPSGAVHYRVGWHTPGAKFKGGTTTALDHQGIQVNDRPQEASPVAPARAERADGAATESAPLTPRTGRER